MSLLGVLRAAVSDVGLRENGYNRIKYWATWMPSWQGQPYCAAGVTDWLSRAGELAVFDGKPIFYCPNIEALAKRKGRWYSSPKVGDIVLYSFGAALAIHVGVVEKVNATTIQTIEANTASGAAGSQNNGDGVYRRVRTRSWGIRGYYRPAYKAAPAASAIPKLPAAKPKPKPSKITPVDLRVDGDFGRNTIKALQRYLGVTPDGGWGPKSKRALQKWVGVSQDGVVGKATIRGLQRKVGSTPDGDWGPNTTKALQRFLNAR